MRSSCPRTRRASCENSRPRAAWSRWWATGAPAIAPEAADIVLLSGGLDRVVRAIDLARESIVAVRQTLGVAARANLGVVGLASFGWARPLTSILLSQGTTM